jgi:hypothetical protein
VDEEQHYPNGRVVTSDRRRTSRRLQVVSRRGRASSLNRSTIVPSKGAASSADQESAVRVAAISLAREGGGRGGLAGSPLTPTSFP